MGVLVLAPVLVFAQLPGKPITLDSLTNSISEIADFLIVIGLLIAIIFIVYGGIKYMSAGSNATQAAGARDAILNGLIGAAVVIGVGVLMATAKYVVQFLTGEA